ncbi:MAG TPA: efflux RND transporter permease subunit [Burkholderiales bacterium]
MWTDIFIRRPVLAMVVSLAILVLGLRALGLLPIRQYPETQNAVVTVTTNYIGADPELVSGFITAPLEAAIAEAEGIDYMTSSSAQNASTIQAFLRLNYDPNEALTQITTEVNAVLNDLPPEAQRPIIRLDIGETIASMYIGFYSEVLDVNQVTDYLIRVVQPRLQAVPGVQTAEILGGQEFAMRAWLDPQKMAGFGVTPADVRNALEANNFIAAVGRTEGEAVTVNLTTRTGLHSAEEFRQLVVKSTDGALVRLGDVATVALGAENYDTAVSFDGVRAVYIGIEVAPAANLLDVIAAVRDAFPDIQSQLPAGLQGTIVYDATLFVDESIAEVARTLIEALLIVTAVVFLFLGSVRSVVIPAVAIPLSLTGALFLMWVLGFSVNLLTLLALVLAIGIVVDDAIIVVENVQRHIHEGTPRLQAAIQGARELANPIIAMTLVLIAVYLPIGFLGGLTGSLFTEFAFTLAAAVTVSGVVALTLSPMMCSRLLAAETRKAPLLAALDRGFGRLRTAYARSLGTTLDSMPVVLVFAGIVLAATYFLYASASSELAPEEDQGVLISQLTAAPNATLDQTVASAEEVYRVYRAFPETSHVFQVMGFPTLNQGFSGMVLHPWDDRARTAAELQPLVQAELDRIAGARVSVFQPPALPGGGGGLPVQFVIGTTDSYELLNEVAQTVLERAQASGAFAFVENDLRFDKAQVEIAIDRDKAAQLGLTMRDIGGALGTMLGGDYVNYFSLAGRSYRVIPQVAQEARLNARQLENYYIATPDGRTLPLSTVVGLETRTIPGSLPRFQQLNSATLSGVPIPGVPLGEALAALERIAAEVLPEGYTVDYAGQSRQYAQESAALAITFGFALIVIFLALAALFESFRDPLIVLVTVPMSVCGALVFIAVGVGGASLNIYTQVGLVTLIGLISRHGILIVEFANEAQAQGKSKREAIEQAADLRLRPILMTTAATVLGVLPLVLASGAGAAGRYNMGLVIAAGMTVGTFFTLYVVPAFYLLFAAEHRAAETVDERRAPHTV